MLDNHRFRSEKRVESYLLQSHHRDRSLAPPGSQPRTTLLAWRVESVAVAARVLEFELSKMKD
ncbi:uncharacterized protein G2W53_032272 [Senna tora]|uniref:Uncharacterized protein n=1 Tax=Senna tora TaxID=362788 RepID=A0A834WA49_9FABA|nr:uncharacterized protein G2W53_032272 [Senna tora]